MVGGHAEDLAEFGGRYTAAVGVEKAHAVELVAPTMAWTRGTEVWTRAWPGGVEQLLRRWMLGAMMVSWRC
jgi:hypothetical protein